MHYTLSRTRLSARHCLFSSSFTIQSFLSSPGKWHFDGIWGHIIRKNLHITIDSLPFPRPLAWRCTFPIFWTQITLLFHERKRSDQYIRLVCSYNLFVWYNKIRGDLQYLQWEEAKQIKKTQMKSKNTATQASRKIPSHSAC